MRLSAESHAIVEQFFREHTGDERLVLPPIEFHGGLGARLLMRAVGMGAITFGRHVFVNPRLLVRDAEGRVTLPGWLAAHEAAHVLQYEGRGLARFLRDYLRGYWRALRGGRRWDARGRTNAYLAIPEECEARRAQQAYSMRMERKRSNLEETKAGL